MRKEKLMAKFKLICEICSRAVPPRNKRFCSLSCSIQKPTNYWVGKKFSKEYRQKLSDAHQGKSLGVEHANWKGESASYVSKHSWMRRKYGTPTKCEYCGTLEAPRFEWANISGDYIRDRSDWLRLCKKCHHKFDNISEKRWGKYVSA